MCVTVSLEGHPDKLDDFEESARGVMASWSSSAPAGLRCPNWIASARLRAVTPNTGKVG